VPIVYPTLVPAHVFPRVQQDGLWGFTGGEPDPRWAHPEKMTEQDHIVQQAGRDVEDFVVARWPEDSWETAWFVNPPRLQSVPGLAHIHVFAKPK